jgi:GNAT superfamily N-acetyltransferase
VAIEPLGRSRRERDEAAMVAARAFHNDPFFEFLSPKPLLRARGLSLYWRSIIASVGAADRPLCARDGSGRILAAAVWVHPGGYPRPIRTQLKQAAGALRALAPHPPALRDGTKYLVAIDKVHPRDEHWYLELLVVDPSVQRLGVGALLQQDVLDEADRSGLPCHLETQNSDNLPYYQRFGYEVAEELHPVEQGPPLWTMRREPR